MTNIHWYYWFTGGDDSPDFQQMCQLVDLCRKYPDAVLMRAECSEGYGYWVLVSGDKSRASITKRLDQLTS